MNNRKLHGMKKENITTFMLLAGILLIIQWDILMKLTEILADW